MRTAAIAILTALAILAAPPPNPAQAREMPRDPAGRARVVDGDTLDVGGVRVRLNAIDAPERHQTCINAAGDPYPCGELARAALARIVEGQNIRCHALYFDRYKRTVAKCFAGPSDIAALMVRYGQAVAYTRYGMDYVAAEQEARAEHRGIWAGSFQPPELWRQNSRRH
jgi:endonuclease YncB( thermonuclease family)